MTRYALARVTTWSSRDAPAVSEQPQASLSHWAIHEVGVDLFLIGWNIDQDCPRYTSQLVQFDRHTRTAVTQSGRHYQLVGAPGAEMQTLIAWEHECRLRGVSSTDVTHQLLNPQ